MRKAEVQSDVIKILIHIAGGENFECLYLLSVNFVIVVENTSLKANIHTKSQTTLILISWGL